MAKIKIEFKHKVPSTQKLLPIREIKKGVIITKDNRYVKVLEILPINYLLKSPSEQNAIAMLFKSLFKAGPPNIQFKVISRKTDMTRHLQILKKEMLSEQSEKCYEMQKEYAQMLKQAGAEMGVTRRFFIAFEYEHEGGLLYKPSEAEIFAQLNTVAARIENVLMDCGNETISLDDEDEQLQEILYSILNLGRSEKMTFEKHADKIRKRYLEATNLPEDEWANILPYIPATEYFAPKKIEFIGSDLQQIDNKYFTYAYIPADGYNPVVTAGWTAPLVNAGEGFGLDIFFNRVPKEQVMFKISQSINQNRASITETSDTQASFETLAGAVEAGMYLKRGMAQGDDFYYMAILITISGDTPREVDWRFNELKKMLNTYDIKLKRCKHEIEPAFQSTLPLCHVDNSIWEKSKRNTLTAGAASTYPFTSFEMCDEDGILLGRNVSNNSLAMINIFDTKRYKNANMFIAGTTGAGKTFALLLIAMRMRIKHIPVIIIAPEKEHEFERVCMAMDGQFIRFGSGSPHCINIMDIFQTDDTVARILDGATVISSKLSEKVQDLKTFFTLLVPDITYEEKELLDEALMETYHKKGITEDNASLIDPDDPSKYREMPILGDLYKSLKQYPRAERITTIINMLVTGSGKNFNRHTNVNLNNEFVVLGLEHLNSDLLPIGMFMAIDYAWSKIKEDRTKRKTMFIDEWWRFAFDPVAADYSLKIAKTIRAYGGSIVFATQQMTDIFAIENGKYGEGVLNNCKTKIVMQLEEQDALSVQRILRLTDTEKTKITRFKTGEALLAANSNNMCIKFESNKTEYDLITTDRKSLEQQVLAKMSEEERNHYMRNKKSDMDAVLDLGDAGDFEFEDNLVFEDEPAEAEDFWDLL